MKVSDHDTDVFPKSLGCFYSLLLLIKTQNNVVFHPIFTLNSRANIDDVTDNISSNTLALLPGWLFKLYVSL